MGLVQDITVASLAAGATTTKSVALTSGLNTYAPTQVLPSTNTSITVVSATTTTITFRNDGQSTATATFRAMYLHSVQAQLGLGQLLWSGAGSTASGASVRNDGAKSGESISATNNTERSLTGISINGLALQNTGDQIRVALLLRASATDAATTVQVRLRLGSTTGPIIFDSGAVAPVAATDLLSLDLVSILTTGGVIGKAQQSDVFQSATPAIVAARIAPVAIAASDPVSVVVTVQFSAAAGGNTIVNDAFVVDHANT